MSQTINRSRGKNENYLSEYINVNINIQTLLK